MKGLMKNFIVVKNPKPRTTAIVRANLFNNSLGNTNNALLASKRIAFPGERYIMKKAATQIAQKEAKIFAFLVSPFR